MSRFFESKISPYSFVEVSASEAAAMEAADEAARIAFDETGVYPPETAWITSLGLAWPRREVSESEAAEAARCSLAIDEAEAARRHTDEQRMWARQCMG